MLDMKGLCMFPNAKLPEKFKMSEIEKFDSTGDPTVHLGIFVSSLAPSGLNEEQMGQLFPRTLSGMALRWLMKLDRSKTRTWEDIGNAFVAQYSYNQQLDVTTLDLETTHQGEKETFSEFIRHWRNKANKMPDRSSEQDQVRMVTKNL